MNKTLVIMGVDSMIIGIGFGVAELISPSVSDTFLASALIWTIGAIATVLGLTLFEKEGICLR
ncbi:hypothetical protein [Nitrosopumilus ureiphilus]|uniref:Uncharacterized protein n=1 Tax=Nitrosopumilus ureiphilus TaxID=1470067 RepID=A0A7D5M6C7_9ARCH|nr:hypothetical protein [Nitrosopumilus ureiphilus]QLH07071.1 hypothetical protein C5F50_08315 [Nitrosopumilus ureiphilus]